MSNKIKQPPRRLMEMTDEEFLEYRRELAERLAKIRLAQRVQKTCLAIIVAFMLVAILLLTIRHYAR